MGALHGCGHLSADPCSECVMRTGGGRIRQESWLLGSVGRSGHRQGSSAPRTQADQGLNRAWETGAVSSFCTSPLRRRRGYTRYVFSLIILLTFLLLSLLPLTSPYSSLPHSSLVSFAGTSESSQHPMTLSKALIMKPTCPATVCPHSGHLDLSP